MQNIVANKIKPRTSLAEQTIFLNQRVPLKLQIKSVHYIFYIMTCEMLYNYHIYIITNMSLKLINIIDLPVLIHMFIHLYPTTHQL